MGGRNEGITSTALGEWREILRHGLELLRKDSDTNRRLAMILIDNAVELMVKTFLALPKRISGLSITRKEILEIGESFPALLDALEKHASDKLVGIDLGTIEWYHRLRNQLYHQGNGLTVERDKVEIYAELANVLFRNLFGYPLVEPLERKTELLGEFLGTWADLERELRARFQSEWRLGGMETRPTSPLETVQLANRTNLFSADQLRELDEFRRIRNAAAHGQPGWESKLTEQALARLRELLKKTDLSDTVSAATAGGRRDRDS